MIMPPPSQMTIDPLTLEVFWSRLIAVVNEQAASLIRTAFSPTVAEAGDISACAFDPRGYLIAQAVTGTPGHINSMARCIRHFLDVYPPETLSPGDVLVTNDPWKTSGHFHDVTVVTPVFRPGSAGQELVAFFGNICHVADIGGRPFSADARELFEEGLFIPITKLFRRGEPNDELLKVIRANVRAPDAVVGDLYAMTAANDVGGERLLEFMDEFGLESIIPLADEVIARSERAMREAITCVPDGTYRNSVTLDGYDRPVTLEVAVTISGDELSVDYAGTSRESGYGINVVMNYTEAYTTFGIKCALAPDVPNNEGSFRPVTITAPEGSILNCRPPAPVAARHIVGQWLPVAVHGALYHAVPDSVLAEGSSNLWITQFNGTWTGDTAGSGQAAGRQGSAVAESDSGEQRFSLLFFNSGGMGARPGADGLSSTAFPSGVQGTPAEIVEARSPLVIHRRELRTDSGGAGELRGGLGHWLEISAPRAARAYRFSPFFDRTENPARGYGGGLPGGRGEYWLQTDSGVERPNPKATVWVEPQTRIVMGLPGGGGIGDPYGRDPGLVREDVRNGLVSSEEACFRYGVVLDGDDAVDLAATERARASSAGRVSGPSGAGHGTAG
ncbi:MAG: N-methylhydantoinase B [uncultured Chloroflexi bacterium]|uniref:N-methylhydantoinase B n=1 Tax=uncultured Chloroflexota bacterium TaxID=166587 RepID=A0A6J4I256_9CHLR|nr:MAG: N-methylhydantoinase B [uncultured Chloroflexota bacterium]